MSSHNCLRILWLCLFGCLLSAGISHAVTRYVDGTISPSSCTNYNPTTRACSGGSATAHKTIVGAGVAASGSDTLLIRSGTYNENLSFSNSSCQRGSNWISCFPSGSSGNPTIISAYPANCTLATCETVTLRNSVTSALYIVDITGSQAHDILFNGLRFDGQQSVDAIVISVGAVPNGTEAARITIQNSDFFNSAGNQISVGGCVQTVNILNNRVHDNVESHGMYISGHNMLVEGNVVYNNARYGIQLGADAAPAGACDAKTNISNPIVRNNVFRNNGIGSSATGSGGSGLTLYSITGTAQVYNNVFDTNQQGGGFQLGFWSTATFHIYSNTFYANDTVADICFCYPTSYTPTVFIRNNIFYQNPNGAVVDGYASGRFTGSNNLCGSGGTGCNLTGNPGFNAAGAGDFHILAAGSPAVNAGTTLGAPYNVDAEGITRPSGQYDIGAYEFVSTPVGPFGNVARYTFEEGAGTTAADSEIGSGAGGHTCTLNTAGWGAGIIGTWALNLDGTRWCQITGTADLRPATEAGLSAWINSTSTTGSGVGFIATLQGDAFALWVRSSGVVGCQVVIAGTFYGVESGSVLTGTNRHVSCSYKSGDGLRLRLDNVQIGFLSLSGTLDYSLGTNAQIGRSELTSGLTFVGRIDQPYIFDQEITASSNTNLFNELVPLPGLSVMHQRYATADAVEGVFVGALDADYASVITAPLAIRWAVHKSDTGSLTEYFRIFCRTFVGGVWGSWTEVGNTLGALGVRFYVDSVVNLGDATSALLPLDGFTATPGKFIADTVDLTSPYDAAQRVTISQSQHLDYEVRLSFGAPLTSGDLVQCRPQRENASDFGVSNYSNVKTLTLQGVAPPTSVRIGGILQGGTLQ